MAKDYYSILGIPKGSDVEEVRKAFKKLARKYHPDINPGDKKAEEKFKELSEAYEVLSNPDKKKKYDTYGSADFEGFPGGGGYQSYSYNPFGGGSGKTSTQFDLNDLGEIFGDIFTGGLGGMGGAKKRRRGGASPGFEPMGAVRGKDLHFSVSLDFLEAVRGSEKKIRLPNGVTFNVKIPAGVDTGAKIRLQGKGEPGLHGGEAGDLYIEPTVKDHPFFKRSGHDIEINLPITITESLEGGMVKVPTIDGNVDLKIPKNSQSGQKLRLKGKGIEDRKAGMRGDQYVHLQVMIPEDIDPKTREELLTVLKDKELNPRLSLFGGF